jgi:hypothetical protein
MRGIPMDDKLNEKHKPSTFRLKLGDQLFMNAVMGEHGTLSTIQI